jgi:hypothetical protein
MSPLRRILRTGCCILIGALLFAQAAFAVRPCVDPGMSAAMTIASQSNQDCCELSVTELNLCAAQCGDSNKVSGPGSPLRLPPLSAAAPVIPLTQPNSGAGIAHHTRRDLAAEPPLILRFCRFLI